MSMNTLLHKIVDKLHHASEADALALHEAVDTVAPAPDETPAAAPETTPAGAPETTPAGAPETTPAGAPKGK